MRRILFIALVSVTAIAGLVIVRSVSKGSNIAERQEYWAKEIAGSLKPGATKEELEAFANDHGQMLHCYQNYKRENQCDFKDNLSMGGTRRIPMRLAVIFSMKNDKVISHQFSTTSANRPE